MDRARVKPSRWFYALAPLILVGGAVLFTLMLIRGINEISSALIQVEAPGEVELVLDKAGTYTIFYEYQSMVDGRVYSTGRDLPPLELRIRSTANEANVPVVASTTNSTYSVGDRSGRSVGQFTIGEPGAYRLSASYPVEQEGPPIVLAIGQGFVGDILTLVLGSIGVCLGSFLLSAVCLIVVFVVRRNAGEQI